jgi:hypothetical protein
MQNPSAQALLNLIDHVKVAPELHRLLRKDGKLVILYMAWLPFEDEIAGRSEELIQDTNVRSEKTAILTLCHVADSRIVLSLPCRGGKRYESD